jgi:hypothetical protein
MDFRLLISDAYKLLVGDNYGLIVGTEAPIGSGVMKRWDVSQWVVVPSVQSWNGSLLGVKYYNGSDWVQVN